MSRAKRKCVCQIDGVEYHVVNRADFDEAIDELVERFNGVVVSTDSPLLDVYGIRKYRKVLIACFDAVDVPPAAPLVGVEPNPGPNNKNKKKPVVRQPKKKKHKQRVRRVRGNDITTAYISSLVDPFQHPGVKLGWGTMVPTTLAQAYVRGVTTTNGDGSLVLVALPQACSNNGWGSVSFFANGAAVANATSAVASYDATAIAASFSSARVVSIGLRSYPIIAATATPGVVYSGAIPTTTTTILATMSPNDFYAFPTSHMSVGISGGSSTGRPIDVSSFEFKAYAVNADGYGYSNIEIEENIPFSIPYQAYSGLPASTSVAYEFVMNFEGTEQLKHSAAPLGQGDAGSGDSLLSSVWGSIERMWATVKPALPPSGRPGIQSADQDGLLASVFRRVGSGVVKSIANSSGQQLGRAGLNYLAGGYGGGAGQRMLMA